MANPINAILKSKLTGAVYYPYAGSNIAPATDNALGGVKIGLGFDSDPDGTISLDTDYISSVFPNFDLLEPALTFEYDISSTGYKQIWSRPNTGLSTTNAIVDELNDTAWYRITVSSDTTIKSITDCVVEFPGKSGTCPIMWFRNRSFGTTYATSGLYSSNLVYPKALNSDRVYEGSCSQYDATARHWKIEVFKASGNIAFNDAETASAYTSTYHNQNTLTLYGCDGYGYQGQNFVTNCTNAVAATAANHVDGYLIKFLGTNPAAGEALVANTLVFLSTDNTFYNISNTAQPINASLGLAFSAAATNSGSSPSMTNIRKQGVWTSISTSHATLAKGTPVYLRCTMDNGAIHSDNYLATSMEPGYTWAKVGVAYSTTAIAYILEDVTFMTLDSNGKLTHVNGVEVSSVPVKYEYIKGKSWDS